MVFNAACRNVDEQTKLFVACRNVDELDLEFFEILFFARLVVMKRVARTHNTIKILLVSLGSGWWNRPALT